MRVEFSGGNIWVDGELCAEIEEGVVSACPVYSEVAFVGSIINDVKLTGYKNSNCCIIVKKWYSRSKRIKSKGGDVYASISYLDCNNNPQKINVKFDSKYLCSKDNTIVGMWRF